MDKKKEDRQGKYLFFPFLISTPFSPCHITFKVWLLTKGVVGGTKGNLFWAPCCSLPMETIAASPCMCHSAPSSSPLEHSSYSSLPSLLHSLSWGCLLPSPSPVLSLALATHTLAWVRGGVLLVCLTTEMITAGMFSHGSILPSGGEDEGNKTYVLKHSHPPTYSLHINA